MEAPKTIDELICGLKKMTSGENYNKEILRKEITGYLASYAGDDWHKYEFWDDSSYTRNLIYQDAEKRFTLALLCWDISNITPIHDHPDTQCFYKLLQGELLEKVYRVKSSKSGKPKPLKLIDENCINKIGTVGYIEDGMGVHSVENQSASEKCVTLHLYAPTYMSVTCYDERTGISSIHEIHNYSEFGKKLAQS